MPRKPPALDLTSLLSSWELSLRAARKSPQTVKSYGDGVRAYLRWSAANDRPATLDRRQLAEFVDSLLEAGAQPSTARSRQLGVRRFSAWLVEENETDVDPLLGVKAPKLDSKVIEPLTDSQLKAMLKACRGRDLRERRDEALIRFMVETGTRAGEVVALQVPDVDLLAGTAVVRKGKGGKGRVVPFGAQTAQAIDRYLRVRRTHRLASTPALWLGDRGKDFNLRRAAQVAQDARHHGRRYRVPPAPAATHRRAPLASCWWLRGRADGGGWLDAARHADAVHQGAGVGASCR